MKNNNYIKIITHLILFSSLNLLSLGSLKAMDLPELENIPATPPICEAGLDPQTIRAGEGTALWWWSDATVSASINHSIGSINLPSDYKWIHPTETTQYILTAKGADGATTICNATVIVEGQADLNLPFCEMGADPQTIDPGQGAALWWWSDNTFSTSIDNGIGLVQTQPNYKWFFPTQTATYTMIAVNNNGLETTCTTTIEVNSSVLPTAKIKLYNPPADVAEFKGKPLYHSQLLSDFGITKASTNYLKSPRYTIDVKEKGAPDSNYQRVFTYQSLNNLIQDSRYETKKWSRRDMTDANHWGSFDFKGDITVKVTSISHPITDVNISPKSKNYFFTRDNDAVIFNLSESQLDAKNLSSHKIALKFSGSDTPKHPLFIFANKFETGVPSTNDANIKLFEPGNHASDTYTQSVLYFKPGLHTISGSGRIEITSDTTVYLAGGAYVMGQFYSSSQNNIKFQGRGILSGINQDHTPNGSWNDAPHLIDQHGGNGSNFSVKGITLTDTAKANLRFDGKNLKVENIKVFSWRQNSDGVTLRANSTVRDSFFKVFDDVIKLYKTDNKAEELVIWQQPSGAIFQLTWNNSGLSTRGYVNNINVIKSDFTVEDEREGDNNLNNAIISARNFRGTDGVIDDFQFNNIRIEGRPYQLLDLGTVDGLVSGFEGEGGSIQNIVLKNITSEGSPRIPSYIKEEGIYGDVGVVTFENVIIEGRKMTGDSDQIRIFGNAAGPHFK